MPQKSSLKSRKKSIEAAMAAASAGGSKSTKQASGEKKERCEADAKVRAPAPRERSAPREDSVSRAEHLIPTDSETLRVLAERAKIYARPQKSKRNSLGGDAFVQVGFGGDDRYGIPFEYAEEILMVGDLTPVPGTPPHIAGVINLRGTLLTVINMNRFFGLEHSNEDNTFSQIAVISDHTSRFGMLVSTVDGSVSYRPEDLTPSISGIKNQGHSFVRGIHSSTVAILDICALIEDPSIIIDERRHHSANNTNKGTKS